MKCYVKYTDEGSGKYFEGIEVELPAPLETTRNKSELPHGYPWVTNAESLEQLTYLLNLWGSAEYVISTDMPFDEKCLLIEIYNTYRE